MNPILTKEEHDAAIRKLDLGLWRLFNLAEIAERAAFEEAVDIGALAHLLEVIKENCDQLHDETQRLTML